MDEFTFLGLVEGEALHWRKEFEDHAALNEVIAGLDNINELAHVVTYHWACSLLQERGNRLSVLDAACGTGYGTNMLARSPHVAVAHGVDINQRHLKFAMERFKEPRFSYGDLTCGLGFIDGQSIDVAVSFHTIEHVLDPVAMINTFVRHLKPDGLLLLISPTHNSAASFLPPANPFHICEFSFALMDELLRFFFGDIRYFDTIPNKHVFDLMLHRMPYLDLAHTAKANVICLGHPRVPGDAEYRRFHDYYLIKMYQSCIEAVQSRHIAERRQRHFLVDTFSFIEFLSGFHNPELGHVWAKKDAAMRVRLPEGVAGFRFLLKPPKQSVEAAGPVPARIDRIGGDGVVFSEDLILDVTPQEYVIRSSIEVDECFEIRIHVDCVFDTIELRSREMRKLSVCLFDFRVERWNG